jgi:thiol:disulfide interchange protein
VNRALRRILCVFFFMASLFSCCNHDPSRTQTLHANLTWHANIETARENAYWDTKPVLILLTSDWCGACKSLKAATLTDQQVVLVLQKFVLVELDIDHLTNGQANRKLMEKLSKKPGWIPSTIIITPWEKTLDKLIGT